MGEKRRALRPGCISGSPTVTGLGRAEDALAAIHEERSCPRTLRAPALASKAAEKWAAPTWLAYEAAPRPAASAATSGAAGGDPRAEPLPVAERLWCRPTPSARPRPSRQAGRLPAPLRAKDPRVPAARGTKPSKPANATPPQSPMSSKRLFGESRPDRPGAPCERRASSERRSRKKAAEKKPQAKRGTRSGTSS